MKRFDVIIIGGGACGCTTAYELAQSGVNVAVIDRGPIGCEASWASAGMIGGETCAVRSPWYREASVLSRSMYDRYDDELFTLTAKRIGLYGRGHMVIARSEDELPVLHAKVQTQINDGIDAQVIEGDEARKREPALPEDTLAAALLPGGCNVDARQFTQVIAEAAVLRGATLFPMQTIDGLVWDGDRVIGAGAWRADMVINAAGAWAGLIDPRLSLPVYPMHGQIMVVKGKHGELQHNLSRAGGCGYFTPRADGRILIGATHEAWGYDKRITPDGAAELGAIAQRIVPAFAQLSVIDAWSGLRPASPDGMATIGADPRVDAGYLWAAGHGAAGIMQTPATAAVVADLVLGREPRIDLAQVDARRWVEGAPSAARGEQFMAV